MTRIGRRFLVLFTVAAFFVSLMAAAASAAKVPGFLLLPGESGPLALSGASTAETELQVNGQRQLGKGVKLTLVPLPGSDDEGTYTADFENVANKVGGSCSTSGDTAGTVLVPNNKFRTVHDITSTTGNGLLFEVTPEFTIICNGVEKYRVRGTLLSLFAGVGTAEGSDFKAFAASLYCKNFSGGEPFEEVFWGLAGSEEKARFEYNEGVGFKKACELIGTVGAATTIELKASKMADLMEVG